MSVHGFDNMDDMLAFMREQERAANANVTPEQAQIGYGDFWVREYDHLLIFGYVPTPDELEASERALGADDDEIAFQRETFADAYSRGYRYGQCYSIIEPAGEWGSTHISTMIKITADQYNQARDKGWRV